MNNWFQRLGLGLKKSSAKISSGLSEILFSQKLSLENLEELEDVLISTDMGVNASAKIIKKFSTRRFEKNIDEKLIRRFLAEEIEKILSPCQKEIHLDTNHPEVILLIGVNGAGKTTTIGKLAAKYKDRQISCIAGDTFRAAAVEQLKIWGERSKIRVYSGAPRCDAASLCFEGLTEALKHRDDIVLIDTAGRLQNKTDLMDELKKIVRVIKKVIPEAPQHIWLCLDATSGQNALDQVKTFNTALNINGLIINKLDGSSKGGILVAVAEETKLPILYVGVGESIEDLNVFNAAEYSRSLLDIS